MAPDARWLRACLGHCERKGYHVAAIVYDTPDHAKWTDVETMKEAGEIDRVVFALEAHMPRVSWMEVAADDPPEVEPAGRRPRRVHH